MKLLNLVLVPSVLFATVFNSCEQARVDSIDAGKRVSLQLDTLSESQAGFILTNGTQDSIFVFATKVGSNEPELFRYWLRCKKSDGPETTYNEFQTHLVPDLVGIKGGQSVRFIVSPLPETGQTCKVSVLFYDNPRAVELIKNPLDTDQEQQNLIDDSKKMVLVEINI